MASWMTRALMVATVGLGVGTFAAQDAVAQESTNQVAAMTDWSVFVEENPKECWGVTAPKSTAATRDGTEVTVRRGEIQLFVTFRPGAGAAGEVSYTGGYPFAENSAASTPSTSLTAVMLPKRNCWPSLMVKDTKNASRSRVTSELASTTSTSI